MTVICDQCAHVLTVSDDAAGKRGKCPRCSNVVTIPAPIVATTLDTPDYWARVGEAGGIAIRLVLYVVLAYAVLGTITGPADMRSGFGTIANVAIGGLLLQRLRWLSAKVESHNRPA